jgi:hypothetical protein
VDWRSFASNRTSGTPDRARTNERFHKNDHGRPIRPACVPRRLCGGRRSIPSGVCRQYGHTGSAGSALGW